MERNNAIDTVKGFAILLVMLGHCIVLNGLNKTEPYLYDMIKSVQMPLFMMVSGVVSAGYVKRNGKGNGFSKLPQRAYSYLVPFFSWFVIVHFYVHMKAGTLSFAAFWGELKELLFQTDRGLWFLMTLFVASVCTMLAQTIADKVGEDLKVKAAAFVCVSLLLYLLFFVQSRCNTFLSPSLLLCYFPFYILGYSVSAYEDAFGIGKIKKAEPVFALLFLAGFLFLVIRYDLTAPVTGISDLALQMAASFLGTVSVYIMVYRMAERYQKRTGKRGFLSFVGIYTLEIYVLHFRFARLLSIEDKNLVLYSLRGLWWVFLTFVVMSFLTAFFVFVLRKIPFISQLLFAKPALPVWKKKSQPSSER